MTGRVVDPVERFLGAEAAAGGPFAILGIGAADATPNAILRATDDRMRTIDSHADAGSPDADEVRLVVHAAAARLLDASTRRVLFRPADTADAASASGGATPSGGGGPAAGFGRDSGGVHLPAPVPTDRIVQPRGPLDRRPIPPRGAAGAAPSLRTAAGVMAFRRELAAAIALSGGWNTRARRRLMKISVRRGISVRALAIAARASGTAAGGFARATPILPPERQAMAMPTTAGARVSEADAARDAANRSASYRAVRQAVRRKDSGDDPVAAIVRAMLTGVGVVFVVSLVTLIAFGVRALNTEPARIGPIAEAPAAAERSPASRLNEIPAVPPRERAGAIENVDAGRRDLENPAAVLREIAAATDELPVDARGSVGRFASAVRGAEAAWPLYDPTPLASVVGATLDYVHAASAGDPATAVLAVEALASTLVPEETGTDTSNVADAIVREPWAIGVLTRMRRERELPETVRRAIDSALVGWAVPLSAAPSTFDGGAVVALQVIAEELAAGNRVPRASRDAAWAAWRDAAEAATQDAGLRATLLTHALTALLAAAEDPGGTIESLAGGMPWRAGDGSRPWLLETLTDDNAEGQRLAALTEAIAKRSGAESVDATMVLARGATAVDRRELRDRYAEAWGLAGASASNAVAARWTDEARSSLADSGTTADGLGAGARAAVLARLNAAAAAIWRGDDPTALDLLDDLRSPVDALVDAAVSARSDPRAGADPFPPGGGWALEYIAANRNIAKRMTLLDALAGGRRLGAADADVLAREVFFGPREAIRDRAYDIVVGVFASQPAVINGVLEVLPEAPATRRTVELVEDLAIVSLPSVRDPAWRSAARRALVERLLELMASGGTLGAVDGLGLLIAEAYSVRLDVPDFIEATAAARRLAEDAADQLANVLVVGDPQLSARSIASRRDARLGMARGVLQVFACEQAALAEFTAALVAAERPGTGGRVDDVLDRLASQRRSAAHVLEQIAACEAAMVELWLLRFGEVLQ